MNASVLMLGWEFPPMINGGLGVASMGLAEALAKQTKVQLILPTHPSLQKETDLEILGLDQMDMSELQEVLPHFSEEKLQDLRLSYIPIPLMGYESFEQLQQEEEEILPPRFFELKQLYGRDLPRKIIEYSELCLKLAEDLEFDLIHAHDWMTFPAALELQRKTGKALVLHIHSLQSDRNPEDAKNWIAELEKMAMDAADLVIAVSHYTAEQIRQRYKISKKKIAVVHNAIAPIEAYKKEKNFKEKLICFIGRLEKQKGPQYFFEMAMKILAKKDGVRFVMAGKGSEMDTIMDQVSTAHIGDKFHFTGFLDREKVMDLLSISDVCVMPSASEPFGLVALEASQMKVPCLIPFQSGAAEVLLDTPKFQIGDIQTMADLCIHLLSDPDYYQAVVSKNHQAAAGLSWEGIARKICELYKKLE